MKQVLKQITAKLRAAMNRLGEDFDMILLEDILPYPADMTGFESVDDGNSLYRYSV